MRPACSTRPVAGEIRASVDPYGFLRGVGDLCAGAGADSRHDARAMVALLVSGTTAGAPAEL